MTRIILVWMAVLAGVLVVSSARAHEVRPAYLHIAQSDATHYRIVFKQPTLGEVAVRLVPHLSNGWLEAPPQDQYAASGFLIRTWQIDSAGPLAGSTVGIEGLENTITDVLVSVELLDRTASQTLLRPEQPWMQIEAATGRARVPAFLMHGLRHIFSGVDHLLFVLGLVLIVRDRWMLIKAVSAFTLAHSITLASAVLAHVTLPGVLVESLIALSILVLGLEVMRAQRGETSLTLRYPWAVAFVFGLFHGMGFAGGLADLGMARYELAAALLMFNLGVEIGQLAFIALALLLWRALTRLQNVPQPLLLRASAYGVGIAGAYWTIRTSATLLGVV